MKLLTSALSNTKTAKNRRFKKYLSYILHLAPSNLSGYNTCPRASKVCRLACLNTAGRGQFNSVQEARIRKTKMLFQDPEQFFTLLIKDLDAVVRKAKKEKLQAVVRLNGTSDLDWTGIQGRNIIGLYPGIQFYDYTKVISRLTRPIPLNYSLTFSGSEVNQKDCLLALKWGFNVAAVFNGPGSLETFKEVGPVMLVDGDSHDLRFLDPKSVPGNVIALTAKGKAKKDLTGFVLNSTKEKKSEKVG